MKNVSLTQLKINRLNSMRILIVHTEIIPVKLYGGTERVVWSLGKELSAFGHEICYLVKKGSYSDHARVIFIDEGKSLIEQIPANFDVVHFFHEPEHIDRILMPYVITLEGNLNDSRSLDKNTIFVSKNHAQRFGSDSFIYNGIDWDEYTAPVLENPRKYFHFLANAAWRIKNVQGAINIIHRAGSERLEVLGGVRFNIKMGMRFTFSPRVRFRGMVGGIEKDNLLNGSRGLLFPVRWNEPFGIAITESLYFGCPVFGTPYGSLPELVTDDVGYLSDREDELAQAILNSDSYSRQRCHEYARDEFNSKKMALSYLKKYEMVINGESLNENEPRLKEIQKEKFLKWK